ncbi:MAG: regulatory iron-sulfur-containing complex subunit RicT [Patescibacteria group bacterium]
MKGDRNFSFPRLKKLLKNGIINGVKMFREEEALEICQELIENENLNTKLWKARPGPDRVLFYYSGEDISSKRSIKKELHEIFQKEIEFRPVKPRDKAKEIGGLGKCGKPLCCARWLDTYPEEAKITENMELENVPEEYCGLCGRSLCCLMFDREGWTEKETTQEKELPKKKSKKDKDTKEKKPTQKKKRIRRLKV